MEEAGFICRCKEPPSDFNATLLKRCDNAELELLFICSFASVALQTLEETS